MNEPTNDIIIPDSWAKKFDLVVKECSGALTSAQNTIRNSIVVMNGIRSLKNFFLLPEVKELIEMSKDNKAGFLTDRSEAAIRKHNSNPNKRYDIKPYSYNEIVDALLPCILEGYYPHGNEINIVAKSGMPVKAGKRRKIIEMTEGFWENISTPAVQDGFAFIKCKAQWFIDGKKQSIGFEKDDEVHIKVKFGKWDSLDKVIGLSQSKFYTRVLTRITGRFIVDEPESAIDITQSVSAAKQEESVKTSPPPPPPKKEKPDDPQVQSQPDADFHMDNAPPPNLSQEPSPSTETEDFSEESAELEEMVENAEYKDALDKIYSDQTYDLNEEKIKQAINSKNPKRIKLIINMLEDVKNKLSSSGK